MAKRTGPRLVGALLATAFAVAAEGQVPAGGEFQVNTFTTTSTIGTPGAPAVAADAAGNFVVTWDSIQDGSDYGVFARRFDAAGAPRGAEFRVNTVTAGFQFLSLDPPACAPPNLYGDVPESSPFCRWIEELTRRGVVGGCGGGNYCPGAPVTREQMAVFVSATFGLTLYGP